MATTTPEPPVIDSFGYDYEFLSNFHEHPVHIPPLSPLMDRLFPDGLKVPDNEHGFHLAKCVSEDGARRVLRASSPYAAKKAGRLVTCRPDWEQVKDGVMLALQRAKFAPGTQLAGRLLATGTATLIEGNTWGDDYWGCVNGRGKNRLGCLLMQVRDELRAMIQCPNEGHDGFVAATVRLSWPDGRFKSAPACDDCMNLMIGYYVTGDEDGRHHPVLITDLADKTVRADLARVQALAWANKVAQGFNTADVSLEVAYLHKEVSEAFDAWCCGEPVDLEPADVIIFTTGLAQILGVDLPRAVMDKLAVNAVRTYIARPNGTHQRTSQETG